MFITCTPDLPELLSQILNFLDIATSIFYWHFKFYHIEFALLLFYSLTWCFLVVLSPGRFFYIKKKILLTLFLPCFSLKHKLWLFGQTLHFLSKSFFIFFPFYSGTYKNLTLYISPFFISDPS